MRILRTDAYERWFRRLKDPMGRARIDIALRRCSVAGRVVGDVQSVGEGIHELRIHTGPGYRIYFMSRANELMLLVVGGDKTSQRKDIEKAKKIAAELIEEGQW